MKNFYQKNSFQRLQKHFSSRALSSFTPQPIYNQTLSVSYPSRVPATYRLECKRAYNAALLKNGSTAMPFRFDNCNELLERASKHYGDEPFLGTRRGDHFEWISFKEFELLVQRVRTALDKELHLKPNEKVALISNNRLEWAAVFYATVGLGGQVVPMYEAQKESDWRHIIEDSGARIVFVANENIYGRVFPYKEERVGKVENILCFDSSPEDAHSYAKLLEKSAAHPVSPVYQVSNKDHVAIMIYTSGTTGKPKGVRLSHGNIAANIFGAEPIFAGVQFKNRSLGILPWAHVFGMTCELNGSMATGSSIGLVPHRDQTLECLNLVQPTGIMSVPLLFNKVYDGVMKNLATQSKFKQALVQYALKTARERNHRLEYSLPVSSWLEYKYNLFDKIVFSKLRQKISPSLRMMTAGGAATSLRVLHFFEDIGIPIMEGYGLTETAPMATASGLTWSTRRLGCVGVPLGGVDVRIVDGDLRPLPANTDGEIVVSGPNVMIGYHNNEKANAEVFFTDPENGKKYFRTGDQGQMVDGRYLKITGRIKEQFKLENGKYVVPTPLEDILARGPFITQSFLYGDNKAHTVLLIVPNYLEIWSYAQKKGLKELEEAVQPFFQKYITEQESKLQGKKKKVLAGMNILPDFSAFPSFEACNNNNKAESSNKDKTIDNVLLKPLDHVALFRNQEFIHLITDEIIRHSQHLKSYEQPRKWSPLLYPFSPENNMLTPKMSIRRGTVMKTYGGLIQSLYDKIEGEDNSSGKKGERRGTGYLLTFQHKQNSE